MSEKGKISELALFGGPAAVSIAPPHFRWPLIGQEEENAVLTQLRSGELSLYKRGGVIQEFEEAFAARHAVPFAMSSHSGTGALHAAFFALDLDFGAEVLAPAYTHLATVLPMLHVGLIPVLCDIDAETGNIDVNDCEQRISPRTRAIVITHQYGHLCDMNRILALAEKHDLFLIEDCSHAHGSTYQGRLAGTFGDAGCFSLQAHKTVTAGEGGILISGSEPIFERASLFGHFREKTPATSASNMPLVETGYGLKNRLHPLGAALALTQFRKLDTILANRRANLEYFAEQLKEIPGVRPLITRPEYDRGGYFRYLLKYNPCELGGLTSERYIQALQAEGVVEVRPGSLAKPLHLTGILQTRFDGIYRNGWPPRGIPCSGRSGYQPGDFPRAEEFSRNTLQFPAFTEPSRRIIDQYCEAMRKVARHACSLAALDRTCGRHSFQPTN